MRSLQIMAPGRPEIVDLPLPEPGPGQVRVKVVATNTCPHWDLHLASGEPMFPGSTLPYPYPPGQPGHEMTGLIDAVGEGVSGFEPGQRVAAWKDPGHGQPGCYAEYVLLSAEHVLAVPQDIDPLRVVSLELAMCVSRCLLDLERFDGITGLVAAVNGLGPAGLIAAQLLKASGASEVIGFEPNAERRELALAEGWVDRAADPRAGETAEAFPVRRGRRSPIDIAIECCGLPGPVQWILDRTTRAVAFFAVQRHDYTYAPQHAGLTLIGYGGHGRDCAEYALERIVAGQLDLRPLASVELPLERYAEGVALLRAQKAIKVCYRP